MVNNIFIDSCIFADWLILKLSLEDYKTKKEKQDFLKEARKNNSNAYYSYKIFEKIGKMKSFIFHTSTLALSEVVSVIHEKYLLDLLYAKHIPFKYLMTYKYKVNLPKNVLQELSHEIIKIYLLYIKKKKIKLADDLIIQEVISLITKNIETHDAYLTSQAKFANCNFFVTKDQRLRSLLRKLKNGVEPISPNKFYQLMNKKT